MSSATSRSDGNALRVLVADDDPIQRSLISERLSRLDGQTAEAEDGAAAWSLLTRQTFDMAIVDLSMPNLDGFGLIQRMRGHPRTRHLPVIVVTSRHDRAAIEAAMEAGASSFLVKPIAWQTFEHHIGFVLRMVQAAKDERTSSQKAVAAHRAREAVLARLCSELVATSTWTAEEVETLRRLPSSADTVQLIQQRLGDVAEHCRAATREAGKVSAEIVRLGDQVLVGNRRERLDTIVDEATSALASAIFERDLQLKIALPPGDTWIACDAEALQLALAHLVENAVRYSPQSDGICLSGKIYPDGLLGIEVTDHGDGMHLDEVARSLAPLQSRLDGSHATGRVGFGLVVAKAVAEAHGGTLELRSMPGQGTTALLVLPPDRVTNIVNEE